MSGIRSGVVIRVVFATLTSIVVSLYSSWVIALIILPSYLIIIGSWAINYIIEQGLLQKANNHIDSSNNMAVEAFENVSTIAALGVADRIARKFDELLSPSYK